MSGVPVIEIDDLVKDYRSLRPLRIANLRVLESERVAIVGPDSAAAETLVNLITGAHLPERGTVRVFGRSTSEIADADAWLALLDRIGIVSERAVLLDAMTVAQNLAVPFSLAIDPVPPETRAKVAALAEAVGLDAAALDVKVGESGELARARVNLARAVALRPAALILEHASARLSPVDAAALAADVARLGASRPLAVLAITADLAFARALGGRVLRLEPATGRLQEHRTSWLRR